MTFFEQLSGLHIAAFVCFALAKIFGLMSVLALAITETRIPGIVFGSLWGLFIVATIVLCFVLRSRYRSEYEKELYLKLKAKYG